MKQLSFTVAEHGLKTKKTRREKFLAKMDQVIPRKRLLDLIESVGGEFLFMWPWVSEKVLCLIAQFLGCRFNTTTHDLPERNSDIQK